MQRRKPLKRRQKPLKRTRIRRVSVKKTSAKTLKNKLWNLIKIWIRLKYEHVCYTCGAQNLIGANCQTGHFIPSCICGPELRYDPRNLRIQCYSCNIHKGGWGERFAENMELREGKAYVDELRRIQKQSKVVKVDYEYWIDYYTKLIQELE